MKSKFLLSFLSGYKDVPRAWPGIEHALPILEPLAVYANDADASPESVPPAKKLLFRCTKIDDDHTAIFEFMGVK